MPKIHFPQKRILASPWPKLGCKVSFQNRCYPMSHTYKYPRPAITVDNVIFGFDLEKLKLQLLLIKRKQDPFKGLWAMPGGFVNPGESLDTAAARELEEECGVKGLFSEQLHTFGEPNRDPREQVISVAYLALVNLMDHKLKAGSDASAAAWFPFEALPVLAFDHLAISQMAIARLAEKARQSPLTFRLLPKKFTLSQLQSLYESILNRPLDRRNFRRKILSLGILKKLKLKPKNAANRALQLYQFDEKAYSKRKKEGAEINFF
jgi:8-oxo-dGTP diphosphatase